MNTKLLNCLKPCFAIFISLLICLSHVYAQPIINSFSPLSGRIGTTVTITGKNFNTTPDSNIVFFGAARAKVINSSTISLQVRVPYGATYQPLSVNVNQLTAYSGLPFLVTFKGGHKITAQSFAKRINLSDFQEYNVLSLASAD